MEPEIVTEREWCISEIVTFDGTIGISSTGEGSYVLMIHGGPGDDSLGLRDFAEFLTDHHIILYDQRGTGRSRLREYSSETLAVGKFYDDISSVIDSLDQAKVVIIGHSWGATLAMLYAAGYPEHVEKLILIGMGPVNHEMKLRYEANLKARLSDDELEQMMALRRLRREAVVSGDLNQHLKFHTELVSQFYSKLWIYHSEHRSAFAKSYAAHSGYDGRIGQYLLPSLASVDQLHAARNVNCPTLILYGRNDIEPIEQAQLLNQHIQTSEVAILDECGHVPWIDQPAAMVRAISDFLANA